MRPTHGLHILSHDTPTALFRSLVRSAMQRQGLAAGEMGEFYLVVLLEGLLRPGPQIGRRPLGLQYLEALSCRPGARYGALRRVADSALLLCGLFPESLERSLVGPDYYTTLGRHAYRQLSRLVPPLHGLGALTEVFADLAARFPHFSAVLSDISLRTIFPRQTDLLHLYRRWCYARTPADGSRLAERGWIPILPARHTSH